MRQGIAVLALLSACGQGQLPVEGRDPAASARGVGPDGELDLGDVDPIGQGAASPVRQPPKTVEVVMGGGATTAMADYLFVVDTSVTMRKVMDGMIAGIDAIAAEGNVFPADARIAVMSTTPSDPADLRVPHPATPRQPWVRLDPGFHGPIDANRIARFRDLASPELAESFAMDGCSAWFAPGQQNEAGDDCLVAHTQTLLMPVWVEAGLTALGQRLSEREPLFRDGAAVNVIFVTDTHDPGVREESEFHDQLVAARPTFERLQQLASANHTLASFRVHAIAPASHCTVDPWTDPVYFDAADASGGLKLDICTAEPADYVEMLRGMVTKGAVPQRGVIPLGDSALIAEVLVDGVRVPASLTSNGRAVVLDEMPSSKAKVTVRYRSEPPRLRR